MYSLHACAVALHGENGIGVQPPNQTKHQKPNEPNLHYKHWGSTPKCSVPNNRYAPLRTGDIECRNQMRIIANPRPAARRDSHNLHSAPSHARTLFVHVCACACVVRPARENIMHVSITYASARVKIACHREQASRTCVSVSVCLRPYNNIPKPIFSFLCALRTARQVE